MKRALLLVLAGWLLRGRVQPLLDEIGLTIDPAGRS